MVTKTVVMVAWLLVKCAAVAVVLLLLRFLVLCVAICAGAGEDSKGGA